MSPVTSAQFVHDVSQVGFDGLFTDKQELTDILISVPRGHMLQDFTLAKRERLIRQIGGKFGGDYWRNTLASVVNGAYSIQHFAWKHGLKHIAARARGER